MFRKSLLGILVLFALFSLSYADDGDAGESVYGNANAIGLTGGLNAQYPIISLSYERFFLPQFSGFVIGGLWFAPALIDNQEVMQYKYSLDLGVNWHILGNKGLDPYLGLGFALLRSGTKNLYYDFPIDVGLNFWFNQYLGLKAQLKFYMLDEFNPELNGGLFFAF